MPRNKVLIISHDKIGHSMAGPGIRYHYMARKLSSKFDVTIGFLNNDYLPEESFQKIQPYTVSHIDQEDFTKKFADNTAVISMWLSDQMINFCEANNIFIIYDMYAPVPVENLTLFLMNGERRDEMTEHIYKQSYSMFGKFFSHGDLYLFSNQRQVDFWTGYVFGTGDVTLDAYEKRPFFDRFVTAPMGIDTETSLKKSRSVLRGVVEGITKDDKILVWTGGIWNWFDAQTLIRAMKLLEDSHPEIKLVFFGTKHPNPNVPAMQESSDAFRLASELNLSGKTVFLKDGWVPYSERIDYLLEADLAISTTKSSLEAEFSHRTRVLDHILTGLPTVSTRGDYLTDEQLIPKGMGLGVDSGDEKQLASAILAALEPGANATMRKNIQQEQKYFDWSTTLNPLMTALENLPEKLPVIATISTPSPSKRSSIIKISKKNTPRFIKNLAIRLLKYGQ